MRRERGRAFFLSVLVVLAGCGQSQTPTITNATPSAAASAPVCRTGPEGAAPVADRGLGGTGAPSQTADRGIGGTGAPLQTADRGIGGTGIIGVITGFASVCLAGQEVALPPDVPVSVDSRPAVLDALRAGQVAAVEARQDASGLRAARIAVRDEVSGPVERASGDQLRILGQDVVVQSTTWGIRPRAGDWVTVSGLRRQDGTIEATRLEPRDPGPVLVRGTLREADGALMIGALPIRRAPGLVDHLGEEVVVTGDVLGGVLVPGGVVPDLLASDPAAFFGPAVGVVLVEGFATLEDGRLRLGRRLNVPATGLQFTGTERGVFRLERVDGGLHAVGGSGPLPSDGPSRFEPAPVPNRSIRAPGGAGDRGRPGSLRGRGQGQGGRNGDGAEDRFGPNARPGDGGFGAPTFDGSGSGGSMMGGPAPHGR